MQQLISTKMNRFSKNETLNLLKDIDFGIKDKPMTLVILLNEIEQMKKDHQDEIKKITESFNKQINQLKQEISTARNTLLEQNQKLNEKGEIL